MSSRDTPTPAKEGKEPQPATEGSERRTAARAPIELRVEYQRLNSFFADYTKNISRGGTFIRTQRPLPIGTDFLFRLAVPSMGSPLTLRGRVQWIVEPKQADDEHDPGMGIGFIYETEADRQKVEGIVEGMMVKSLGPLLFDKLLGHRDGLPDE